MAEPTSADAAPVFQALYPASGPADLPSAYRPTAEARRGRRVRVNMVASVDGGTSVGGTSGSLGGPADRVVFALIRSFADIILVGSGTMRAEGYGPARLEERLRQARVERGQLPVPAIAVVSGRVEFSWDTPFFAEAEVPPLLVTVEAAKDRIPASAPVGDVVLAGGDRVDLEAGLDALTGRGYRDVLVEGGPTINAELAARDAIDELCVTVSPKLVAGTSSRIVRGGDDDGAVRPLRVASVITADEYLFLRYQRG